MATMAGRYWKSSVTCGIYQDIFAERIRRMLEEEAPEFRLYDESARLALVIDNDYANQDLHAVMDQYRARRRWLIERLSAAPESDWLREGASPPMMWLTWRWRSSIPCCTMPLTPSRSRAC